MTTNTAMRVDVDTLMYADIHWCTLIYIDVRWYTLMYADIRWCTLIYVDVRWYTLMYADVRWCTLIYIDVRWYTLIRGKSVASVTILNIQILASQTIAFFLKSAAFLILVPEIFSYFFPACILAKRAIKNIVLNFNSVFLLAIIAIIEVTKTSMFTVSYKHVGFHNCWV